MAHGAGSSLFGTLTGWELQTGSSPEGSQRSTYSSKTNNVLGSTLYNKRKEVTQNFKAKANYAATAPTIPAAIGALLGSLILTRIHLTLTNNGFVMMSLTGHQHTQGTSGNGDGTSLRSIAHNITLTKGFGAGALSIAPGGTFDSIRSADLTIECDHEETADADGNTTQGENHNPRISGSFTVFGTGPVTPPSGYDMTQHTPDTTNEGYATVSIQITKDLAFAE